MFESVEECVREDCCLGLLFHLAQVALLREKVIVLGTFGARVEAGLAAELAA